MVSIFQNGSLIKLISTEDEAAEAVRNILGANPDSDRKRNRRPANPRPNQADADPLRKCAEDILAGVKRPTAVESITATKRSIHSAVNNHLVQYLVTENKGKSYFR